MHSSVPLCTPLYPSLEGEIWGEATALYHKIIPKPDVADNADVETSADVAGGGLASGESGSGISLSSVALGPNGDQVGAADGASGEGGGGGRGDDSTSLIADLKRTKHSILELREQVRRRTERERQLDQQHEQQQRRPGMVRVGRSRMQERKERETMEAILVEAARLIEDVSGASISIEIDEK